MNCLRTAFLICWMLGLGLSMGSASVWLSSTNFTTGNLPTIHTNDNPPQPYRMRAKFPGDYHAIDGTNNNGAQLQNVPGPGTYIDVELYWVLYEPDLTTIIDVGPKYKYDVTISSATNAPPTIEWSVAPAEVEAGQPYFIQAHGADANGNLQFINVWKAWTPFAFGPGGNGFNGWSGNSTSDTGGQWVTYQAQAMDSSGATSAYIYHNVYIKPPNRAPTVAWEIIPSGAPAQVNYGGWYAIRARGTDADGNLAAVHIYREEQPFAFQLNGNGSSAFSEGPDYAATRGSAVTYRAEAIDSNNVSSPSIYVTVYVNDGPTAYWNPTFPSVLYINDPYSITAIGTDLDNNLKELRVYESSFEFLPNDNVNSFGPNFLGPVGSSNGMPVSYPINRQAGRPFKWRYVWSAIAEDMLGRQSPIVSVGDAFTTTNRPPNPPTIVPTQTSIGFNESVTISARGTDPDNNAVGQHLWYRHHTTSTWTFAGEDLGIPVEGTGNTVVNFTFTPTQLGLTEFGLYYFKTFVHDPYEGQVLDTITVGVVDNTPPNPPTNLYVSSLNPTWVYLNWTQSNSSNVAGQNVYWQLVSGGPPTDVALGYGVTGVSITDLTPGSNYRFTVKARNGGGYYSNPSNEVTAVPPVPVTITSNPQGQTINIGETVHFTVGVAGTIPYTFQWRKNGTAISNGLNVSGATSQTLMLTNVQPFDAGSYGVEVVNAGGSDTSTSVSLVVIGTSAPVITSQPANQTVNAGGTAFFTVSASGTPSPTYLWRKNSIPIPGATTTAYIISQAQPGDAGSYSVVVTNNHASVPSDFAVLTVNVAPVITTQPQSLEVNVGGTATFTVTATGTPTPGYQWRKNGADIAGATNSSYTVGSTAPLASDSNLIARYGFEAGSGLMVVDTSGNGRDGSLANGAQLVGGKIGAYSGQTDGVDDYISLPASVNTALASLPVSFAFWVNMTTSNEVYGNTWISTSPMWDGPSVYTGIWVGYIPGGKMEIDYGDGGGIGPAHYRSLLGAGGSLSNGNWQHIVAIIDGPSNISAYINGANAGGFLSGSGGAYVAGSGASRLGTVASASGELYEANAMFDDVRIYNRALTAAEVMEIYNLPSTAGVQTSDAGTYSVFVSNSVNGVTSSSATLTVASSGTAPIITTQPQSQTVNVGGTATFMVAATGTPTPTYQWRKNDVVIAGATNSSYTVASAGVPLASDSSLIARYAFEAGSGPLAADSSGNGRDGSFANGAGWVPGKMGVYAAQTDGVDDYISLPASVNAVMTSLPVSFAFWVNMTTSDETYGNTWISTSPMWDGPSAYTGIWVGYIPGGKMEIDYGDGGGTGSAHYRGLLGAGGSISNGNWHHIVAVIEGPSNISAYINGANAGGFLSGWGGAYVAGSGASRVGTVASASGELYEANARFDDVRVYNRALTAAEVMEIYNLPTSAGVQASDAGVYTVVVSSNGNSVISSPATLTVAGGGLAPTITTHPQGQAVNVGGTATFTVVATGTPTPTYQWQRSAGGTGPWTNLVNGSNYSGVTITTLTVSGTTTVMTGDQFRCVATSSAGSVASNAAILTVVAGVPIQLKIHRP